MISQLANLNWLSVLLAFVTYFLLGALWFTLLFSKAYKQSLGKAGDTLPTCLIFIAGPALCTFVITVTSALLLYSLQVTTLVGAAEFAAVTGGGFLVANTINIAINPNIPRPILYGIISGSYHLAGLLLASVILVLMK